MAVPLWRGDDRLGINAQHCMKESYVLHQVELLMFRKAYFGWVWGARHVATPKEREIEQREAIVERGRMEMDSYFSSSDTTWDHLKFIFYCTRGDNDLDILGQWLATFLKQQARTTQLRSEVGQHFNSAVTQLLSGCGTGKSHTTTMLWKSPSILQAMCCQPCSRKLLSFSQIRNLFTDVDRLCIFT